MCIFFVILLYFIVALLYLIGTAAAVGIIVIPIIIIQNEIAKRTDFSLPVKITGTIIIMAFLVLIGAGSFAAAKAIPIVDLCK